MSANAKPVPLTKRTVLQFLTVGVFIYGALLAASETLVFAKGHNNPFFKIETADKLNYDWVILGASHAMPFVFGDTEARLEAATGQSVINLAVQGAGPLYNRMVFDQFLEEHRARGLIYVVDSFAFNAPIWNEGRISDPGLLARTPFDASLGLRFWAFTLYEGISPLASLDFSLGFSKVNNRERFERDIWDGESQFERRYKPSARAEDERIAYLYPTSEEEPGVLSDYLKDLEIIIARALGEGMVVKIIKPPVPASFYRKLPNEASFDRVLDAMVSKRGLSVEDDSLLMNDAEYFFDSDHLGRLGVEAYIERRLIPLMNSPGGT